MKRNITYLIASALMAVAAPAMAQTYGSPTMGTATVKQGLVLPDNSTVVGVGTGTGMVASGPALALESSMARNASNLTSGYLSPIVFPIFNGDVLKPPGTTSTTIQPGVVSNSKLATVPGLTLKGNASSSTNSPSDLTISQIQMMLGYAASGANADITSLSALTTPLTAAQGGTGVTTPSAELSRIGAVSNTTSVTAGSGLTGGGPLTGNVSLSIGASAITNSMLANVPNGTLKANISGSAAAPSDVTISNVFDSIFGTNQGSVIYRGASAWTAITPGTAGQVLSSGGPNANVSWVTPSSGGGSGGSGTVTSVALSLPAGIFNVTGSPVTTSGTLTASFLGQGANQVFASPSNGAGSPGFRALAPADLPANNLMQGRLTLTTGTPIMTQPIKAAPTIYYTPYKGNIVTLWNGTRFAPYAFTEYSQSLSDTTYSPSAAATSACYDAFAWLSGSTVRVTRGPAWSAGATAGTVNQRGSGAGSTALTTVNGLLVNANAITNGPAANAGTYVGSFCTDYSTATVTFAPVQSGSTSVTGQIDIWNYYNRIPVTSQVWTTGGSWTGPTSSSYREVQGTLFRVYFVSGVAEDSFSAQYSAYGQAAQVVNAQGYVGVQLNNDTGADKTATIFNNSTNLFRSNLNASNTYQPALGLNYVAATEAGDGTNATTYYGTQPSTNLTVTVRY